MELALFAYVVVVVFIATLTYMVCISTRHDVDRRFSVSRLNIQRILAENGRRLSHFGQRIEQLSQRRDTFGEIRRRSTSENFPKDSEVNPEVPGESLVQAQRRVKCNIPRIIETPPASGLGPSEEGTTSLELDKTDASINVGNSDKGAQLPGINKSGQGQGDVQPSEPEEKNSSPIIPIIVDNPSFQTIPQRNTRKVSIRVECAAKDNKTQQRSTHLNIQNPNSSNSIADQEKRKMRERRDSVMPIICDHKSLPRRKSFLPVLTEESAYGRRLSLLPAADSAVAVPSRRGSVLVKPPAYVCPRKSSVLFNSDIFARSPRRRSSVTLTSSKLSRTTAVNTGHDMDTGSIKTLDAGRRCGYTMPRSSHVGYYPGRRKSSIATRHQNTNAVNSVKNILKDILPDLQKALASGGSKVKDILKAAMQKNDAKLPYVCQDANMQQEKTKSNYLTGNLSEYKDAFGPDAHDVLSRKQATHGSVYEVNALGQRTVFLFDHRDIDLLKKAEGRFPKHMDFKHLRLYRKRNNLPLGLLLSNGEEWKVQRNVLSKLLLGTATAIRYVPVIQQVAKEAVSVIKSRRPVNNDNIYDPEKDVANFSIEAFGRVLYGRDLQCLEDHGQTDLHHFVDIAKQNFEDAKALLTLPSCLMLLHPAWRRHNERWNFLLETTIKQVRLSILEEQKSFCLLSQLLKGGKMSEPEMLVNLTDILLASIDTTTNALLWCLYELAIHPEAQTRIFEEVCRHSNTSYDVTFEALQAMTYTKAVIKETLRIHPVGFLSCRTIPKGMLVRGHAIPAKSNVANCMFVMGRSESLGSDMTVFRPERWLVEDSNLDQFYHDVPFGFGPRMCIGKRIAEIEIATYITQFCCTFEFSLNPACHIDHLVKLLLVPSRPLELVLKSRARDAK